jgi:hypothetical protein
MVYGLVRGMRFWDFNSAMQTWAWLLPVFQQVRIFFLCIFGGLECVGHSFAFFANEPRELLYYSKQARHPSSPP